MFDHSEEHGKKRQVTPDESDLYRYSSYDGVVDVLVRQDCRATPCLDVIIGLHAEANVMMVIASAIIVLSLVGVRFVDRLHCKR